MILGTDAFNGLEQWYQWQQIFELANIVIMRRPDVDGKAKINKHLFSKIKHRLLEADNLKNKQNGGICFVPVTQLDISATMIRQQWQSCNDIQFFLPDSVLTLIQQQNIY